MGLFNRNASTVTIEAATQAAVTSPLSGVYTIDPAHTRVGFSARHAMVTTVRGQFGTFEGTASFDAENPAASSAQVVIQAASIDTGSADRDGHLRSADFFDAETYPEIRFASTAAKLVDAETWERSGALSITIRFEYTGAATDPFGNKRIGFEGGVTVNRKDWGLSWNAALETGGVLVSEKVKLELDVSAIARVAENA